MRRLTLFLFLIMCMLAWATPVEAHANLVRANPEAGSALEVAPSEIVLEFSEELDPEFTRVRLLDSESQVINTGPGTIDPQDPRVLRLAPGALEHGTYTAIWRVRSAVDGHVTEGSVPFGVGMPALSVGLIPPPGTPEPATEPPPVGSSVIRWLNLLAAALALGALPFALFVWRPVFAAVRSSGDQLPHYHALDEQMKHRLRRLILIGSGLLLVASVLFLVEQAALAADVGFVQALGAPLVQMLASRSGYIWLARVACTIAIMIIAARLPAPGAGARWPWWAALGIGAALLLTFSLNSHGAAEQQGAAVATALDWLHIAATTTWIGGLIPLGLAISGARRGKDQALPIGMLIPRFSALALVSVAVLAASGTYSYFLHVGNPLLLRDTTYGRALALKLVLFVLLVGLGAWNLLVLGPGLRKANTSLARSFGRTIAVELVLAALVLLAVGAMTSVAPSKTAWAEQQRLGLVRHASVPGVDLRVQVAPAQIGDNEIAVDVRDERPGAQAQPAEVLLRFTMVGMEMGQLEADTTTTDAQRYITRGNFMSMGGRWNMEVIVRRAGFEDVRQTFEMDIVKSSLQ